MYCIYKHIYTSIKKIIKENFEVQGKALFIYFYTSRVSRDTELIITAASTAPAAV